MAATAKNYGIISVLNELFTSKYGNQFFKIQVPPAWMGKNAMELYVWLKKKYNAILLSVENRKDNPKNANGSVVNPEEDYIFKAGDHIIVISHHKITLS